MASETNCVSASQAFWRDLIEGDETILVERITLGNRSAISVCRLLSRHDSWDDKSFAVAGVLCHGERVHYTVTNGNITAEMVVNTLAHSRDAWKLMNPTGWISITRFVKQSDGQDETRTRGPALANGESQPWRKAEHDATLYLDRFSQNKSQRSLHLLWLEHGQTHIILIPMRKHHLYSLCRECYTPRDVIDVLERQPKFTTGECESCSSTEERMITLDPINKRMAKYLDEGTIIVMVAYDMEQVIESMSDKHGEMTSETDVSMCQDGGLGLTINITASLSLHEGATSNAKLTQEERVELLESFQLLANSVIHDAGDMFAIATTQVTTNNTGNDCLDVCLLMDVRTFENAERAISYDMSKREEWSGVVATRPLEQVFARIILRVHQRMTLVSETRSCNALIYCHAWNGDKWDNVFFAPSLIDELRAMHYTTKRGKIPHLRLIIGSARRVVAFQYEPTSRIARTGKTVTVGLGIGDTMKLYGAIVPLRSIAKSMNVLLKTDCPFALVNDCYRGRVKAVECTNKEFWISPRAIEDEWAKGKDIDGKRVYTPYGQDEATWRSWRDANMTPQGLIDIYKATNDYCLIDTRILPIVIKLGVIDGSVRVLEAVARYVREQATDENREQLEEKAKKIESLDVLLLRCLTATTAGATLAFGQLINLGQTVITPASDGFKQAFTQTAFGGMCTVTKQGMFAKRSLIERLLMCVGNARHFGALPKCLRIPFVHVFRDEDRLVTLDISGAYGQAMCENMPKGPFRKVTAQDLDVMMHYVARSRGNFAESRKKPFNFGTFVVECIPPVESFWPRMKNFVPIPFKVGSTTVWEKQPYFGLMNLHHVAIAARWGYSLKFFLHPSSYVCEHKNAWPLARGYGQTLEKLKQEMEAKAGGDPKSPFMVVRSIVKNLANSFCGKMGQRAQTHVDHWHVNEYDSQALAEWTAWREETEQTDLLNPNLTHEELEQACQRLHERHHTSLLNAPLTDLWEEPLGEVEVLELEPLPTRQEEIQTFKKKLRRELKCTVQNDSKTFHVSSTCVVTRRKKRGTPAREGMIWNFSKITSRTHEMIGHVCATVDELIPAGTRSYQTWRVGTGFDLLQDLSEQLPVECFPTSFARDTDSCHAILTDDQYRAFMELHGIKNADGTRRQATYDEKTDVLRMFMTDETSACSVGVAFYIGKKFYGLFETKTIEKMLDKLELLAQASLEGLHASVSSLHILAHRMRCNSPPRHWNDKLTMARTILSAVTDQDICAHLSMIQSNGISSDTICNGIVSWSCQPLKTKDDIVNKLIADEMYETLVSCRPYKSACKGANTKQVSIHTFLCALGLSFPSDQPEPATSYDHAELTKHHAHVQRVLRDVAKNEYYYLPSGERERRAGMPATWRVAFTTTGGVKAAKFMTRIHMRPAVPPTGRVTVTGDIIPNSSFVINNLMPVNADIQASASLRPDQVHAQAALAAGWRIEEEEEEETARYVTVSARGEFTPFCPRRIHSGGGPVHVLDTVAL